MAHAVELNPVQPRYWYALADAYEHAKDYKNAIPMFEKAAELGAPAMGAHYSVYEIARCYALSCDKAHAIQALERNWRVDAVRSSQPRPRRCCAKTASRPGIR